MDLIDWIFIVVLGWLIGDAAGFLRRADNWGARIISGSLILLWAWLILALLHRASEVVF